MFYPKTVRAKKCISSLSKIECSFCPKSFTHQDNFHQHANRYHLEEIEGQWTYDSARKMFFPNAMKDRKECGTETPGIRCEFCSKVVRYSLVPHANKLHFDIISKIWPNCEKCNMYFPTIESLNMHNLAKHKLMTRQNWKEDLTTGRRKILATCEFCFKTFRYGRNCWRHAQKEHLKEISQIWLNCPDCNLYYPNNRVLDFHKMTSHRKNKIIGDASPKKDCDFCAKSFRQVFLYTRHANEKHKNLIGESWHKCPLCHVYVQTENCLVLHKRTHAEFQMQKVSCPFCDLKFKTRIARDIHANKDHEAKVCLDWNYCHPCALFFPADNHKHFRTKSSLEIICKFCSVPLYSQRSNIAHCNKEHLDQITSSWFQCQLCLKYLPNEKLLNLHTLKNCSKLKENARPDPTRRKRRKIRSVKSAIHSVENSDREEAVVFETNSYSTRSKRSRLVEADALKQEEDVEEFCVEIDGSFPNDEEVNDDQVNDDEVNDDEVTDDEVTDKEFQVCHEE